MKGTFYPKLVKVFYTYACVDFEGNLCIRVNGVNMTIGATFWKDVASLSIKGVQKF